MIMASRATAVVSLSWPIGEERREQGHDHERECVNMHGLTRRSWTFCFCTVMVLCLVSNDACSNAAFWAGKALVVVLLPAALNL